MREWTESLLTNNAQATMDMQVMVSNAAGISREWRAFVVRKKVVGCSLYRTNMRLTERRESPKEVMEFAEGMCDIWTPADVFAMDVGESGGSLYVVECGGFNSCGVYAADMRHVVAAVNDHVGRLAATGQIWRGGKA